MRQCSTCFRRVLSLEFWVLRYAKACYLTTSKLIFSINYFVDLCKRFERFLRSSADSTPRRCLSSFSFQTGTGGDLDRCHRVHAWGAVPSIPRAAHGLRRPHSTITMRLPIVKHFNANAAISLTSWPLTEYCWFSRVQIQNRLVSVQYRDPSPYARQSF